MNPPRGPGRLRALVRTLARVAARALTAQLLRWLLSLVRIGRDAAAAALANRTATSSVLGEAPVVVSLASHGRRLRTVHLAVEAIAAGTVRPRRLVLWVPDAAVVADPPPPLARLVARGLELRRADPDRGPHNKYWHHVVSCAHHELPLVTADDDVLYGPGWLEQLLAAHARHPQDVVAHRAHRIRLENGRVLPYAQWGPAVPGTVSRRTFATGLSGVLYPPRVLDALREAGPAFERCCPRADDVWLHVTALRLGVPVRPVADGATTYPAVPGTVWGGLWPRNVLGGGNDAQVAATYTPEDVAVLWRDQLATEGPVPRLRPRPRGRRAGRGGPRGVRGARTPGPR
ncbi:hypothetical protein AS188_03455 [Kocuria flava]|uniref:Glycosyltransferase n=1 Tax=Kocuria flava TaxID=446860 RepID=A0A0U3I6K7_9MICC|nr:hypothetical protein [Kocuria flava]ALU38956.1 hypothetical protein AS188_03455 [Kocuria flava]GEO91164.1 hypothetical protein KFL01_04700 [Kocuria flava]